MGTFLTGVAMIHEGKIHYLCIFIFLFLLPSCHSEEEAKTPSLFELVSSSHSNLSFRNDLSYDELLNPYTFRNFYNGAGIAIGDINNDGLPDIYVAGNQSDNKLYLNKGGLVFEDITKQAGVACSGYWSTGVSMVDINGDGLLDIYVCKSGPLRGDKRHNELFINQGNLTFTEEAKAYGLDEMGLSQHAVFFDYDLDGDLDMYLLSNSPRSIGVNDLRKGQREIRDPDGGNKLFKNEKGRFIDVSEEAGIFGSSIGYGLGVTVTDINKDGYPDLYVSNDFFEKDYFYLNMQDGTFREALEEMINEISMGAMGADIADLNNNGWQDIFVSEMLPEIPERFKTKTPFEDWDKHQASLKAGYYHQFTRNTLQKNLGFIPGTQEVHFAEIGRMAGVEATDWSWGALIFDADNDGLKDIFVANGIVKDLTDFDYVDFYVENQQLIQQYKKDSILLIKMIDEFPSQALPNYWYKNLGDFRFENQALEAGMPQSTFSTGAAYADLDNDGDLDLVVNNLQGELMLFKNNASELFDHHYLQLDLGSAFGTQVYAWKDQQLVHAAFNPMRGYMSSVEHRLHLGLGAVDVLDSLVLVWPGGNKTVHLEVKSDQSLSFRPPESHSGSPIRPKPDPGIWEEVQVNLDFVHQESSFIDFNRERLRHWMISNEGPKAAVADIQQNGRDDLFITGAKGQPSMLYIQNDKGDFIPSQADLWAEDKDSEDVDALFFDANGNGLMDLVVVSGSIEDGPSSSRLQDRLYLNQGNAQYKKAPFPAPTQASAFVKAIDIDNNGLTDLIIGTRAIPFAYGLPGDLHIYKNLGDGEFKRESENLCADCLEIGMLKDLLVYDFDGDGWEDLILAGEFIPIVFLRNLEGKGFEKTQVAAFENTHGLWNSLALVDVNKDGNLDLIAGNLGLNSRFKASAEEPIRMYVNDFDQNGSVEQILTQYFFGQAVPFHQKNELIKQLPFLKKQLLTYEDYQSKRIEDLIPKNILDQSLVLELKQLEHGLWLGDGKGGFEKASLPSHWQSAPIYAFSPMESDGPAPSYLFLLAGGNQTRVKPEFGGINASYGFSLKHSADGSLESIPAAQSGWFVRGEIRDLKTIKSPMGNLLLVLRNNDAPVFFRKTSY